MASASPLSTPQAKALRRKLCFMMFLQFFIWGAWFELGFDYIPKLGFAGWQNAMIFGAFNIGALVALFFSTQFADRKFAAEKFVSFSHLIGGLAILGLFFLPGKFGTSTGEFVWVKVVKQGDGPNKGVAKLDDGTTVVVDGVETDWAKFAETPDDKKPFATAEVTGATGEGATRVVTARIAPLAPFWPFFLLMLLHSVFYVPTISITNSIAFANLRDPAREFGPVRLWGTIGWIAASWPFIFILVDWAKVPAFGSVGFVDWLGTALGTSLEGVAAMDLKRYIFLVAGIASLALAVYSLNLPHTPPKPATSAADSLAWLKAARLLKHPFVAVLFLVTFIDAAVHQSFFFWTFTFLGPKADGGVVDIPANWVGPVMKIGQIAEIVTMLFLGYVLKIVGWRTTMIVGVLGHAARFAVFAYYPEPWAAIADQRRPRHLLRVLLRHGVHLRGRVLPEGRAFERPGAVQRADPRCRAVRSQLRLRRAKGTVHRPDDQAAELHRGVPVLDGRGPSRRDHSGALLPPAEARVERAGDRQARGICPPGGVTKTLAASRRRSRNKRARLRLAANDRAKSHRGPASSCARRSRSCSTGAA